MRTSPKTTMAQAAARAARIILPMALDSGSGRGRAAVRAALKSSYSLAGPRGPQSLAESILRSGMGAAP